jgi:FHA domain
MDASTSSESHITAYATLEFNGHVFYIESLSVVLGRRVSEQDKIDVDLGSQKNISRQHARIAFNFAWDRFEIEVLGLIGLWIDGVFRQKGSVVPLEDE